MCFMKFPKELLTRNDISDSAKILYMVMLDRRSLSERNKWQDEQGTYIYYTVDEVQKILNVSKSTAQRLIKELSNTGLIIRTPQAQHKPYKIYVQDITVSEVSNMTPLNVSEVSNMTPLNVSEVSNMTPLNVSEVSNMTPEPDLYNNNTYSSSIREGNETETERIKTQINYDELRAEHKGNERTLDLIVQMIASSPNSYSGIDKQIVSEVMNNIKNADLKKVRNFKAYLKAFIDNAYYKPSNTKLTSYEPTYSITEYESTSITDFITDDYFKPKV